MAEDSPVLWIALSIAAPEKSLTPSAPPVDAGG